MTVSISRLSRYVRPVGEQTVSTIRSSAIFETAAKRQSVRERTTSREPIGSEASFI